MGANQQGKVQTVLGLIDGSELGPTTCHEHLLWDMSVYFNEPTRPEWRADAYEPVSFDNLYWVRSNPGGNVDNMRQTDEALAIEEAMHFARNGGRTIVELSQLGLGRDPAALERIAKATGLNIVMGSGYYVGASHPPELESWSEEKIAADLVDELTHGVADTGLLPGVIGEIGCSTPFTPGEEKVLRACALAQQQTGVPINIHPSIGDEGLLKNIKVLKDAGADLSRVAVSHIDGFGYRADTIRRVADEGCFVEYDGFGQALYHFPYMGKMANTASDMQKIVDIKGLFDDGYGSQVLIAQDICFKACLAAYGGYGYGHLMTMLPPAMEYQGLDQAAIDMLYVENPRRFLELKDA